MIEGVVIKWLWERKAIIGYILAGLVVAGVIWWFFIHNPEVIKKQQQQIADQQEVIKDAQGTVQLNDTIQTGKEQADANTQAQISSIRKKVYPRRNTGVFMPGGRL